MANRCTKALIPLLCSHCPPSQGTNALGECPMEGGWEQEEREGERGVPWLGYRQGCWWEREQSAPVKLQQVIRDIAVVILAPADPSLAALCKEQNLQHHPQWFPLQHTHRVSKAVQVFLRGQAHVASQPEWLSVVLGSCVTCRLWRKWNLHRALVIYSVKLSCWTPKTGSGPGSKNQDQDPDHVSCVIS